METYNINITEYCLEYWCEKKKNIDEKAKQE